MNDYIICQGKGCNIQINKNKNKLLCRHYKCDLCDKQYCINCMYLWCCVCKNDFACFWCGVAYKHNNDKHICNKCVNNNVIL